MTDLGNRCFKCMEAIPKGNQHCPYCGHVNGGRGSDDLIPEGSILHARYLIGISVQHTDYSTRYVAFDCARERKV